MDEFILAVQVFLYFMGKNPEVNVTNFMAFHLKGTYLGVRILKIFFL